VARISPAAVLTRIRAAASQRVDSWMNTLTGVGAATGKGQDMDTARDTAWGALNGLTYWQNHVAGSDGERGRKADQDSRFEKVIFGKHTEVTNNATLLLSAIANTRA
jgi:hypothetical protein